jgi:cellulose synthase/poly-beta-1,6-N-acetylglucosamine synthase-like glycosyltransferase
METFVSALLALSAGLLAVPIIVFFLEVAAANLPMRRAHVAANGKHRARIAVVVPAHNESKELLPTIVDIHGQLHPGDRLIVVADNCSDDTVEVASSAGAEVAPRVDPNHLGKGYALEFGVQYLASDPPEIVIIVDADCRLAENTVEELAARSSMTRRPVQALYLMTAPRGSRINHRVAEFAWRVKNWVRPLGLSALNLPCQLVGTGMAFPWNTIRQVDLGSGWIVEDLKLGLDLASAGYPPLFCPTARVTSEFASSIAGAQVQRERWEQGHIRTIGSVPRMIWNAIARRNWALLALALDIAVPPLSLLGIATAAMFLAAALAPLLVFSSVPFAIAAANLVVFLLAGFIAWMTFGRDVLPLREFLSIAQYALGKLGLYLRILSNKADVRWIRTDRTKVD